MRLVKAKANPSCSTGSNLDRLIADLKTIPKGASLQQRMDRIRQHPIHARDVWRHVYQDTGSYHREIIETNALFQLLIITWLPGQKSPIHNHRDSQCSVRVLSGFAIETVYLPRTGGAFSSEASIYKQGESFGGEDDDIHTLENQPTAAKPLVTLHAYFPPLRQMDLFRVKEGELKMVGPE